MEESQCEDYEDLRATKRPNPTKTCASLEPAGLSKPECSPVSQSNNIDTDTEAEDDILYGVDAMKELFSSLELRISQQSNHIIFATYFHVNYAYPTYQTN